MKRIIAGNPNLIPINNNVADICITIPFTSKPFENKIDYQKWCYDWAKEVLRVLKPGGIMMCIAPELSYHRMTCGIEDAGFEIRDCIVWFHSTENEKALLKPDYTPISIAQKPLDKNYVNNALKWGVAGYWIDGGRIPANEELGRNNHMNPYGSDRTWNVSKTPPQNNVGVAPSSRWPANIILDNSNEVEELMPYTKGGSLSGQIVGYRDKYVGGTIGTGGKFEKNWVTEPERASRFFYKANTIDELISYLVRLTKTPVNSGGIVLDPFMCNDTIMQACELEERDFIGIKQNSEDKSESY